VEHGYQAALSNVIGIGVSWLPASAPTASRSIAGSSGMA